MYNIEVIQNIIYTNMKAKDVPIEKSVDRI